MKYEFKVEQGDDGCRLGVFLRRSGVSCTLLRSLKCLEDGITVDGARAKTDLVLRAGQVAAICVPDSGAALPPCAIPVPVVYESRDVIVYDKPAGMATHPTLNHREGTLANVYAALLASRGQTGSFRPTNRLDRNTSGLVLAVKSRFGVEALAKSARKRYFALVEGDVAADGEIIAPIGRAESSIISRCVRADGQYAHTIFTVARRFGGHTLLEVETLTGRTHQIRVHMAHIGHPLAGDDMYGGSREAIERHALHCGFLSFTEPFSGETVALHSPIPADMQALIDKLSAKSRDAQRKKV